MGVEVVVLGGQVRSQICLARAFPVSAYVDVSLADMLEAA